MKSEETARRLLAVAERSAKGYVQSGLLTEMEAAELLSGIAVAQRRLRLDPPQPVSRDPKDLMRMCPLLDPTHGARVSPPALAKRLVEHAGGWMVRRYPGDAVRDLAPPGGLMLLARGVIDVTWSRPIGDGGGGSVAPLRVGASSTSYGWAYGAADLLVPGAARFDARAVSTVTAFVVPPDVVSDILKHEPTADALWRAAFGLLAATLLRDDLAVAEVTPQALRAASAKARVTRHAAGDAVGPFKSRVDPQLYPPSDLVVLMKGTVHDAPRVTCRARACSCRAPPPRSAPNRRNGSGNSPRGWVSRRRGLGDDAGETKGRRRRRVRGRRRVRRRRRQTTVRFRRGKTGRRDALRGRRRGGASRVARQKTRRRRGRGAPPGRTGKAELPPGAGGIGVGKVRQEPAGAESQGRSRRRVEAGILAKAQRKRRALFTRDARGARHASTGSGEFSDVLERTETERANRGSSRGGSPEVSAHSGATFVRSPHGSSENLGALASEGTDLWSSSLDRTSAHILSRDVKRDIFSARRSSVDAQHKAATLEAASLAGSLMAARADVSPTATLRSSRLGSSPRSSISSSNLFAPGRRASPTKSPDRNSLDRSFRGARRDSGTSMPARMTRQQLAQLKDEDTFPPRGGRSSDDTFPPRGWTRVSRARRRIRRRRFRRG